MKMLLLAGLTGLLIAVACGSDDPASTAITETSSAPTASPTPISTSTRVPATVTPTQPADAVDDCLVPHDPVGGRVEDWPDPSDFYNAIVDAFPWDVPDDIPDDPKFSLSHGMEAPERIAGDKPVTFSIGILNRYDESIAYEMRNDPGYDFAVIDDSGEVVWMYSDQLEVESVPSFIELEPGETDELTATWDLIGRDGNQVEDGLYFVAAILFREDPHVEIDEQFVYIGEMPLLEDALDIRLDAVSEVKCGETLTLTMEVTNITDEYIQIFTGQDVDNYFAFFTDSTNERTEVWNWWADKWIQAYGLAPYLPPRETASFTRVWELQDNSGEHVAPGTYELKASFRGSRIVNTTGDDGVSETIRSNELLVKVVE